MNIIRWLLNIWSFEFGGWDYKKHQCASVLNNSACVRCRYHPGQHIDTMGKRW